jgi:hypothetical protein
VNLQVGSKGFHVSLWMIAAVAAFVLYKAGRLDGIVAQASAAWTGGVDAVLHVHQVDQQRDRRRGAEIARLSQTAKLLQVQADSARWHFDSLATRLLQGVRDTLERTRLEHQVVLGCGDAIRLCTARGDSLGAALDTARAQIAGLEMQRQQSDSLLRQGERLKGCRFLLFTCPTRTTVAEASAVGAVVVWELLKGLLSRR